MSKIITAVYCLLVMAVHIYALGKSDTEPQKVEVSGIVRLVGSSPMSFLVISGEDREWYVEPDEQDKLMHLQQQFITVSANEYYRDQVFANGSSAGRYYFLKNIVIVKR